MGARAWILAAIDVAAAVAMAACGVNNPTCPDACCTAGCHVGPLPEAAPPPMTCEQRGFPSPDDSGTCPQGFDVGHDVSLVGAGCCMLGSDASLGAAGPDAVSHAPSDGSVDGGDAAADAGGQ